MNANNSSVMSSQEEMSIINESHRGTHSFLHIEQKPFLWGHYFSTDEGNDVDAEVCINSEPNFDRDLYPGGGVHIDIKLTSNDDGPNAEVGLRLTPSEIQNLIESLQAVIEQSDKTSSE